MAPGFALVLLSVALAAIAPLILLVSVAFCFSRARRPQALRWLLSGFIGGVVAVAAFSFLAALVAPSQPQAQPEASFVLFGAGFSAFTILRGALPFFIGRWQRKVTHA
jgi:uncharacterized membrane protein HdeD (DUF308 family)